MRERFELWLKIACLLLAGLLLYKLARSAVGGDPLAHLSIPVLPSLPASTNASSGSKGTNSAPPLAAGQGTNTSTAHANRMGMAAMAPGARQMMGGQPPELPPAIRARVDRITDSELLGPVMRPLPLALLGIAGDVVFLRAPSGQTGLVKEGGDLGGIKLLHIGTNRVLVEQDGQKKELSIFEGFGGESLLPKPPTTANETTNR